MESYLSVEQGLASQLSQLSFLSLSLYWICYSIAYVLFFYWSGIKPTPPALEGKVKNHWTIGAVPESTFFQKQKLPSTAPGPAI